MTYAERRATSRAYLLRLGAPMSAANLTRLAKQYETSYRRWRASKRPPAQEQLRGALCTARVFWSLAREAARV